MADLTALDHAPLTKLDTAPFSFEAICAALDPLDLASPLRRTAEALLLGYPHYAASVALKYGKPDSGWRALDQLVKDGARARFYANRNQATCALLGWYAIPYDTPAARQNLIDAWLIVKPRLEEARAAGWLTIAEYLGVAEDQRPPVTYRSQLVVSVYRDPTYRSEADPRYVIRFDGRGAGSKRPHTLLKRVTA